MVVMWALWLSGEVASGFIEFWVKLCEVVGRKMQQFSVALVGFQLIPSQFPVFGCSQ